MFLHLRYDEATDTINITADACPYRKQNSDYADYLLTAVYFESLKTEKWEIEAATEKDAFYVDGEGGDEADRARARLVNQGENEEALEEYKRAVMKKMGVAKESQ